jgi:hypothetical protein
VTNNNSLVVTVPASGSQGFYRLLLTNNTSPLPATLYLGTDSASGQGVLKSSDGGINWNTAGPAGDTINALAVNPAFPATIYAGLNGGRDAFIASLTPSGQLYSSTYLGGSGADRGNAIAAAFADVYVTGTTASSDFPTTAVPAAMQKEQPIFNDAKLTLTTYEQATSGSDGGDSGDTGREFIQAIVSAFGCPSPRSEILRDYSNSEQSHDYNTFFLNGLNPGVAMTGAHQLPAGLSINPVTLRDGRVSHLNLEGTTAVGEYTFSVDYEFIDIYGYVCTWTVTYTIVVLP